MRNAIDNGQSLLISNSSGSTIPAGKMVVIGARVAIAAVDIPDGGTGQAAVRGQFSYAKKSTDTFAQGAVVYLDATNNQLTSTSSGNTLAGYAGAAAGSGAATMPIVINA